MAFTPQTYYRSQACKELAERVNSIHCYESLNITVNVDQVLNNRQSDVPLKVHEAIQENRNFVLFADEKRYIIIIPCKLAVACYVNGKQETMEVMNDMQQFLNRVKIAFVVYDKFYESDRLITSGNNGNGPLPLYTTGEDLQDRENGT